LVHLIIYKFLNLQISVHTKLHADIFYINFVQVAVGLHYIDFNDLILAFLNCFRDSMGNHQDPSSSRGNQKNSRSLMDKQQNSSQQQDSSKQQASRANHQSFRAHHQSSRANHKSSMDKHQHQASRGNLEVSKDKQQGGLKTSGAAGIAGNPKMLKLIITTTDLIDNNCLCISHYFYLHFAF